MQLNASKMEAETCAYFDAYTAEMNKLIEQREVLRARCADPDAFDTRLELHMESFQEATYCLECYDFIYLEALLKAVKTFLDSEQPS